MKIKNYISKFLKYKFVSDSLFTFISFAILSVSGILLNVIIGNHYTASGLGVFSQSIALYTIFSVIAIFGLNISVVKLISQYKDDINECKQIFSSAFFSAFLTSFFLTSILFLLSIIHSGIFFNSEVTSFSKVLFLGIPFFTLNKMFLALLNSLRKMKEYSIIQSIRWIFISILVILTVIFKNPITFIAYSFIISDIILFIYFMIKYLKYLSFNLKFTKWYKTQWIFGGKSVLLGFMAQTNNKIDVFLISFFLSNHNVGIYSFAAEIVKGFLSFSSLVQLNINPIISELWAKKDISAIQKYTNKISRIMLLSITCIFIVAAIIYPFFINIFMMDISYQASVPIFYILLIGVFLPAIYFFTGAYFAMANLLNISFILLLIIIFSNAIFAFVCINLFGIYGAAISTSLTYLLNIFLMRYFLKNKMGISILKI